jgi:hypothetical protein
MDSTESRGDVPEPIISFFSNCLEMIIIRSREFSLSMGKEAKGFLSAHNILPET